MITRRTISYSEAAATFESFEADYKIARKTKNPQILEKYFECLSDEQLQHLCKTANIKARKRVTRIEMLATTMLKHKSNVQKALRLMHIIVTNIRLMALIPISLALFGQITLQLENMQYDRDQHTQYYDTDLMHLFISMCILGTFVINIVERIIKIHSLRKTMYYETTGTKRLLKQVRILHKTIKFNKMFSQSRTKKSSKKM